MNDHRHKRRIEAYKMIAFKNSSLYGLMNEALLEYLQYCHAVSLTTGVEPLAIVKDGEIPYLSEWFDQKGFGWLNEMEKFSFKEDAKYNDFVDFQQLVWTLNKDTDDCIHLFAKFTNYMNHMVEFSRAYGKIV